MTFSFTHIFRFCWKLSPRETKITALDSTHPAPASGETAAPAPGSSWERHVKSPRRAEVPKMEGFLTLKKRLFWGRENSHT